MCKVIYIFVQYNTMFWGIINLIGQEEVIYIANLCQTQQCIYILHQCQILSHFSAVRLFACLSVVIALSFEELRLMAKILYKCVFCQQVGYVIRIPHI